MLCQSCEALATEAEPQPSTEPVAERPESVPDQLCSRCGQLIGREETERRARKKASQLEKFGLAGKRRSLLKPKEPKDRRK